MTLVPSREIAAKWSKTYIFDLEGVNITTTEEDLCSEEQFGQFGEVKRAKFWYAEVPAKNCELFTGRVRVMYHSYVDLDPYLVVETMNYKIIDGRRITCNINRRSKKPPPSMYKQAGVYQMPPGQMPPGISVQAGPHGGYYWTPNPQHYNRGMFYGPPPSVVYPTNYMFMQPPLTPGRREPIPDERPTPGIYTPYHSDYVATSI